MQVSSDSDEDQMLSSLERTGTLEQDISAERVNASQLDEDNLTKKKKKKVSASDKGSDNEQEVDSDTEGADPYVTELMVPCLAAPVLALITRLTHNSAHNIVIQC